MAESKDPPFSHRDAVIFIPGLLVEAEGSFESIIGVFKGALEHNADTALAKFEVNHALREEDFDTGKTTRVSTLTRSALDESPPTDKVYEIDLYEMNYHALLTNDFASSNRVIKILRLVRIILMGFLKVANAIGVLPLANSIRRLGRQYIETFNVNSLKGFSAKHLQENEAKAKSFSGKMQLLFGVVLLALLVAYLVILVTAGVETTEQLQQYFSASDAESANTSVSGTQVVVIAVAILNTVFPTLRQSVVSGMVLFPSAIEFISPSWMIKNKDEINKHFQLLLEHIAEKQYHSIHIVAYSFGTVIAIDSFFPQGGTPATRFGDVDTMVTIGCPYDLIRLFWPHYFTHRRFAALTTEDSESPTAPRKWINVYHPSDIFGSNFKNSAESGDAEKGILLAESGSDPQGVQSVRKPDEGCNFRAGPTMGGLEYLMMGGFAVHSTYWSKKGEGTAGQWINDVVKAMYQGEHLLS